MSFNHTQQEITDSALRLLSRPHRRELLALLQQNPREKHSLTEIADELHTEEEPDEKQLLINKLHHTTLPLFEKADILRYDPDKNIVHYDGDSAIESVAEKILNISQFENPEE